MLAMKERLRGLDFEGKLIEQLLKDYPPRKIEEKLDLLMETRNIQKPTGWLVAALKNDYQGEEQEYQPTPHPHLDPPPSRGRRDEELIPQSLSPSPLEGEGQGEGDKILSTEEAVKRFRLLRQKLMAMNCSQPKM